MNRAGNDIQRINNVIKKDNEILGEKFIQLISLDVSKVVGEYFYLNKKPMINIEKNGKEIIVNISFVAENVKQFKNL